jgi:RES domain-containing protein
MIYATEHYATALLEKLAHGSGALPPNQHFITITIPRGLACEMFSLSSMPGWDNVSATVSKAFGEAWQPERRSVVLIVPSVVARIERHVLINPAHPEFRHITTTLHEPVFWGRRLFCA